MTVSRPLVLSLTWPENWPLVLYTVVAIAAGVVILILYRRMVSGEFEPIPVALTLVGLVDVMIIVGIRNRPSLANYAAIILFFLYAVFIAAIFQRQRRLTDRRIERVLKEETNLVAGVLAYNPDVLKWIEIGESMVDSDIFPTWSLENLLGGTRREHRQQFWEVLPDTLFKKRALNDPNEAGGLTPDSFLIPIKERRSLQVLYSIVVSFSLLTLVWVVFFIE